MTYFTKFPQIYYDFKVGGVNDPSTLMVIRDITHNVRIRKEVLSNVVLYDYYHIQDGETPEIISEKVYGSPLYHWVTLLVNSVNFPEQIRLQLFNAHSDLIQRLNMLLMIRCE